MKDPISHRPSPAWLSGGGELGELIRAKDWSQTPLGPVEGWPQSLRTAVGMLLPSRAQIILFWGPEFVSIYNDTYRPVFALKHPWALGRPGREAWSEVWNVLEPLLRGVVESGDAFGAIDHPFVLARLGYPEETYFDISYDPVRDESGGVGGIYCIVSETTGRVIGERRLHMLRQLGKALADARTVPEVFEHGAVVLAEASKDIAFAACYAWDPEKRLASRISAVNVPADAAWAPEVLAEGGPWPLKEALASGVTVVEGEALAAIGAFPGGAWPESSRHVKVFALEIPGEGPRGILILGASPRRPFEETYRDYLRLVAASFASALANARAVEGVQQRAEMLAQLDRAKTAFFSNVSHEFRTPLTLLLSPLQDALAAEDPASPAVRGGLETAHRNALRMLKLVNTLLDFSRIEAGRMQASFEPVDLAQATAELASNFSSACDKAGLAFDVRCASLAQSVWVDRDMWEKVILNLVANAFKFTLQGGIEVRLEEGEDGPVLTVADTGIGIDPESLPRLFERFHRIEGVRARTHEGSGIGLALVHELVGLHGGRIEVESEPGRGSSFRVYLKYGTSHLPTERLAPGRDAADAWAESLRARAFVEEAMGWLKGAQAAELPAESVLDAGLPEPGRILVADDNADMRDYIARLLRSRWEVETAIDGEDALARIRRRRFDLVISDVMMPRLDGFGLLRAIRGDPALATTPIILLSARAGEEARIEGLDAGADDYLVKPFGARELVAQVRSQLAINRMRESASIERGLLLEAERLARGEAQLQRERLVSLFTQTPNPIVILRGRRHVVELANPAACRVWGRKLEEVAGKPLVEALPELRGQGFDTLLDQVWQSGQPYHGREMPARLHRNGSPQTVHFNFVYTPMRSAAGEVEGVLVSAFDVSEEVRSRELLQELRVKAEEANRTKDAFLAMLGHELRNPLSPIVNALKVLRMRGVQRPELDIVERQAGHLTRLVDDLLDVSRITRGKLDLRKRLVNVSEIVSRALEMASPLIEERRIRVEVRVPAQLPPVLGDADRLAQVVSNLLTNAAKYSNPGSNVRVECEHAGDCIALAVQDEGVGIAPDMQAHIFDLFVQQEQTIDRAHGGLGLGLAIVRSLVEMHGGRVGVRSEGDGRGSRFTIELPVAQALGAERRSLPAGGGFRSIENGALRILIVDDNADAVVTLGEALTLIGHSVQVAHDGESALGVASEFRPDVALIDIGLPRMDGYELARKLRALPAPPGRLFAITGYGRDTDRSRAMEAGFDRHFIKPVQVTDLDAALAEAGEPGQLVAARGAPSARAPA